MVSAFLSEGIALKSKLSRLLVAGNFAALNPQHCELSHFPDKS